MQKKLSVKVAQISSDFLLTATPGKTRIVLSMEQKIDPNSINKLIDHLKKPDIASVKPIGSTEEDKKAEEQVNRAMEAVAKEESTNKP